MSTIPGPISPSGPSPDRRESKSKPARKPDGRASSGAASFKYGYRDVQTKLPHGEIRFERVPLTLEDVLHPRFGDVHVLSDAHGDDCLYLREVLKARYHGDKSVAVFYDVGIFWDIPELKHHSPDISLIFGVKRRKEWKSFNVATEQVRPVLIIEVTSPDTRVNDVTTKVEEYAIAGVPHYVIVDAQERAKRRRIRLICYRLAEGAYERQEADELGRVWLEPVGLWLGVRRDPVTGGDRVALFDPATGEEIGDYTAMSRRWAEAERRADEEARGRAAAEARASALAAARVEAEERLRQAEAELRRLRGDE